MMLGFCMAWSITSLLTYKAHNYETMLVCRFLLGITEAPVCFHNDASVGALSNCRSSTLALST